MKTLLLPVVVVLLSSLLPGQQPAQKTAHKAAQEREALLEEYSLAMDEHRREVRRVRRSREVRDLQREGKWDEAAQLIKEKAKSPADRFVPRFAKAADGYAGKPEAAMFLSWIAAHAENPKAVRGAVDRLMARHLDSPALEELAEAVLRQAKFLGEERARQVLQVLIDKSPHKKVQAQAIYSRAKPVRDSYSAGKEEKAAAEVEMQKVERLVPGTLLAMLAKGPRLKKLFPEVGDVAPEIHSEDLDGVPFKLSDYRGKVVLLDFWGDW